MDALLGLGDVGSLNRRLLRQPCQILARLGLLLAGHFELISNVGELLGAISLSLRMSRDLTERRHPALLNLLRLGSCSEQLLHQILKLLGALRLLLRQVSSSFWTEASCP